MELCFYRKKKKKETLVLKVILPYDFSSRYQSSGPLDMSDANASILPIKGKINFRQIIPKKKKKRAHRDICDRFSIHQNKHFDVLGQEYVPVT